MKCERWVTRARCFRKQSLSSKFVVSQSVVLTDFGVLIANKCNASMVDSNLDMAPVLPYRSKVHHSPDMTAMVTVAAADHTRNQPKGTENGTVERTRTHTRTVDGTVVRILRVCVMLCVCGVSCLLYVRVVCGVLSQWDQCVFCFEFSWLVVQTVKTPLKLQTQSE